MNATGEKPLSWNQQGPAGPQGAPGSALAYAYVTDEGRVVASRSKNMEGATVTRPPGTTGRYCFLLELPPERVNPGNFCERRGVLVAYDAAGPVAS